MSGIAIPIDPLDECNRNKMSKMLTGMCGHCEGRRDQGSCQDQVRLLYTSNGSLNVAQQSHGHVLTKRAMSNKSTHSCQTGRRWTVLCPVFRL